MVTHPLLPDPASLALDQLRIKRRIDEIYTEAPFYGARKMAEQLQVEGFCCCHATARKYMQQMGIEAIGPGPNLSRRNQEHQICPYLLRGLPIDRPNLVWGTDVTYLPRRRGQASRATWSSTISLVYTRRLATARLPRSTPSRRCWPAKPALARRKDKQPP